MPMTLCPWNLYQLRGLKMMLFFVDGHTRAFAAFLCGFSEVPVNREKKKQ
jgi:hypothetical protein